MKTKTPIIITAFLLCSLAHAPVEMRANRRAEKYFRKKYGVNWDYLNLYDDTFWKFPLRYP